MKKFKVHKLLLFVGYKIFIFILTLFVTPLFAIVLLLLSPIYIARFLVSKCSRFLRPDLAKMLSTRSMLYAVDDINGNPTSNLIVVTKLKGTVEIESLREVILDKVVNYRINGKNPRPEMQQYITQWIGFLFWKIDPHFDIRNHVNVYKPSSEEFVDEDKMKEIEIELLHKPHSPKRSPWEVLIVQNYRPRNDPEDEEPKSVITVTIHHSIGDGYSLAKMMAHVSGVSDKCGTPIYPKMNPLIEFFMNITFVIRAPFEAVEQALESYDNNEWHNPKAKKDKIILSASSSRIPVTFLKDIKNIHNVTLTSLILGGVAGGIRKFMLATGVKVPKVIHCGTALPMKGHPSKLRNYMTACLVRLPIGKAEPVERLKSIHRNLEQLKRSTVPTMFFTILPITGGLFTCMVKALAKNNHTTAILSNFPGPAKMSFLGNPVIDMSFGSGLLSGTTAIIVAALSYDGAIKIVVEVDRAIVPPGFSPDELMDNIMEEIKIFSKKNSV